MEDLELILRFAAHYRLARVPDQLEAVLELPRHSKEQVEFIIAIVDEHGACDDELRDQVYKLFRVQTT